jgi:hypothetical protein
MPSLAVRNGTDHLRRIPEFVHYDVGLGVDHASLSVVRPDDGVVDLERPLACEDVRHGFVQKIPLRRIYDLEKRIVRWLHLLRIEAVHPVVLLRPVEFVCDQIPFPIPETGGPVGSLQTGLTQPECIIRSPAIGNVVKDGDEMIPFRRCNVNGKPDPQGLHKGFKLLRNAGCRHSPIDLEDLRVGFSDAGDDVAHPPPCHVLQASQFVEGLVDFKVNEINRDAVLIDHPAAGVPFGHVFDEKAMPRGFDRRICVMFTSCHAAPRDRNEMI